MSIVRGQRPASNYYVLDKQISEDKRLSWAARGLLVYLLGKPDHWKVSVTALVNETAGSAKPTGRDGVYSLLRELEAARYIRKEQARGDEGQFRKTDYIVTETPFPPAPLTADPCAANPTQVSIESKQVMKGSKTSCADGAEGLDHDALPAGLDAELWESYVRCYHDGQEMAGKPTPHANWERSAKRKLASLVSEGCDPTEVVERAIMSGACLLLSTKKRPGRSLKTTTPANSGHHHGHTGH